MLIQLPVIALVGLLTGLLIFPFNEAGLLQTLNIFIIPTFLGASLLPLLGGYQEEINFRQSSLMAVVSLGAVTLLTALYLYSSVNHKVLLITVYAVPVSFRYLIIRSTFLSHVIKALPYAMLQSVVALPFIHHYYGITVFDLVLFFLVALLGLTSVTALIAVVNIPFLRDFGISTMDMMRISFQVLKGKEVGEEQLEEVFKRTSIKGDVGYTVFSFRCDKGPKAIFIVPSLHPGPVKGIAGSRLTEIMAEQLEDDFGITFTFHGPSTHVQNPIKEEDCTLLSADIRERMGDMKYTPMSTHFITSYHNMIGGAQILGDGILFTASFSPQPTEDIDAPIGEIITMNAYRNGFHKLGFVDAHNCVQKGAMEIYYPSRRYKSILENSSELMNDIKGLPKDELHMGIGVRKGFKKSQGISGEGIKVAVLESNGVKNALILIDGNNMVAGLREAIQEEISDLVHVSEVMTTDSHEVNTLTLDYNPVGLNMDHDEIIDAVREVTEAALQNMEPVEVGVSVGELKNFSLMGPIGSNRLNAVAETIYRMAPMIIGMSFVIQALATTLIILLM